MASCDHSGTPPGLEICTQCSRWIGRRDQDTIEAVVLSLPWGELRELRPGDSLVIGRELGPLAGHLAGMRYVSRRHAEVRVTPTAGFVVNHSATNDTILNGTTLASGAECQLGDGVLQLSSQLRIEVEIRMRR